MRRLLPWVVLSLALGAPALVGQTPSAPSVPTPFTVGEALRYDVRVAPLGHVGQATMWIEGPVEQQGVAAWRLRFDLDAGLGPVRGLDRTSSWIDPVAFATVRYEKREDHPLSRHEERVTIDRVAGRWHDEVSGATGPLAHPQPLDELSFLYLLRTLPLEGDSAWRLARHFDVARNPVLVRVLGREIVATPAGTFRTRVIEMEVRDPRRYHGVGRLRLNLDETPCRRPVRIESRMPTVGVTTLLLTGSAHPPEHPGADPCGSTGNP